MKLTWRYRFSASHRLDTPALSAEENRTLYGKCNNPYGHGHDYVLDVTVDGSPDESGRLWSARRSTQLVRERVLARFDHRNLNRRYSGVRGPGGDHRKSGGGRSRERWRKLALPARLDRVRISETERNIFELEAK